METGNGLKILINCNYLPHHDWMTFVAWYSIIKYLPDTAITIYCDRSKFVSNQSNFTWARKIPVKFSYVKPEKHDVEIPCDVMAVRIWNGPDISEASLGQETTFCSYQRCGNFVLSNWINSVVPPFAKADNFVTNNMSINEIRILELWKKVLPIYTAVM